MSPRDSGLRFEANDKLPMATALGLGLQLTAISLSATILITTVVMRAAGQSEAYLTWAVVAAVAKSGGRPRCSRRSGSADSAWAMCS